MALSDPIIPQKHFAELRPPKTYRSLEDVQLWNAFRAGDEQAFIFIYEDNFDRLYTYGLRIAGDECLVEDAIQEVFIDLKNNRSRINETDSIKFTSSSASKENSIERHLSGCTKGRNWKKATPLVSRSPTNSFLSISKWMKRSFTSSTVR